MKKIIFLITILFFLNTSKLLSEQVQIEVIEFNEEKFYLWAEIYKSKKIPAPSVIILHGCLGTGRQTSDWAKFINDWGFNVIILDSFSGRTNKDLCREWFHVSHVRRAIDPHFVSAWVASQEWSTKKIGAIGFSHGASTLINAVLDQFFKIVPKTNLTSAVAFYPSCFPEHTNIAKPYIPFQIHHGENDDWNFIAPCKILAEQWNIKKDFFSYKDSYHGFDVANLNSSIIGHVVKTNNDARELSMKRTKEFFEKTLK